MIFRVKVCGITRPEDLLAAVEAGADAVGFNFYSGSPRHVTPQSASRMRGLVPAGVKAVGVFVNCKLHEVRILMDEIGLDWAQFHGDERPADLEQFPRPWYPAVRPRRGDDAAYPAWKSPCVLIDATVPGRYGGTGQSADWALAARIARRRLVILAGGLGPETLEEALAAVRPQAVDLNSGVEDRPGIKSPRRLARAMEILGRWRRKCEEEEDERTGRP
ncbi:MAG: N-(5'-phosphoribosyl)anthranilate isomerase [Acidobacteriota bacterium]